MTHCVKFFGKLYPTILILFFASFVFSAEFKLEITYDSQQINIDKAIWDSLKIHNMPNLFRLIKALNFPLHDPPRNKINRFGEAGITHPYKRMVFILACQYGKDNRTATINSIAQYYEEGSKERSFFARLLSFNQKFGDESPFTAIFKEIKGRRTPGCQRDKDEVIENWIKENISDILKTRTTTTSQAPTQLSAADLRKVQFRKQNIEISQESKKNKRKRQEESSEEELDDPPPKKKPKADQKPVDPPALVNNNFPQRPVLPTQTPPQNQILPEQFVWPSPLPIANWHLVAAQMQTPPMMPPMPITYWPLDMHTPSPMQVINQSVLQPQPAVITHAAHQAPMPHHYTQAEPLSPNYLPPREQNTVEELLPSKPKKGQEKTPRKDKSSSSSTTTTTNTTTNTVDNAKEDKENIQAIDNDAPLIQDPTHPGLGFTYEIPESGVDFGSVCLLKNFAKFFKQINSLLHPLQKVGEGNNYTDADGNVVTIRRCHPFASSFRNGGIANPYKRICFILAFQPDRVSRKSTLEKIQSYYDRGSVNWRVLNAFLEFDALFSNNPFSALFEALKPIGREYSTYEKFRESPIPKIMQGLVQQNQE